MILATSWRINLCVYACVCRLLLLIPFLSWTPVSEASGAGICGGRKNIKGQDRRLWCLDSEPPHSGDPPEAPLPGPFSSRKPLCSVLASDPEALGSSRLLTLGQSFLARRLPPWGAPLSALGGDCSPNQEGGALKEEGN